MGISLQDAQQVFTDQALRTQYGLILPPGARVAAYVRSTGQQSGDDAFLSTNLVATLALGLARVRSGLGDFVVCLPGHVENVADATAFSNALLAGTKIIGVGKGGNTPTFTWTNAASQWLVNKNDVAIIGLRMLFDGNANPTLAISITANDVDFLYNEIEMGNGVNGATTGITVSGAASRVNITGNIVRAVQGGGTVNTFLIMSGTGSDCRIADNEVTMSAIVATGVINVTGAVKSLNILRNVLNNTGGASVAALGFSNVAITGTCSENRITVLSTGAQVSGTTGIAVGGTNNVMGFFQNFVVNDPNKSGILQPVADT